MKKSEHKKNKEKSSKKISDKSENESKKQDECDIEENLISIQNFEENEEGNIDDKRKLIFVLEQAYK